MKLKITFLAILMMVCTAMSFTASATEITLTTDRTEARAIAIKERVDQIKAMDLKHLSATERKGLKHELKDMNKELRQMGPTYVYISGGALLLIIILLILLL